uniref:Uncharacterized protein n=1 Tax=Rhizophora mucronata TaxID=61149 RepID=A0A2P2P3Y7_RHIMU
MHLKVPKVNIRWIKRSICVFKYFAFLIKPLVLVTFTLDI